MRKNVQGMSTTPLFISRSNADLRHVLPILSVEHLYFSRTHGRKPNKTECELQKIVQGTVRNDLSELLAHSSFKS